MKIQLALFSAAILLAGCAGSYPERVVTKGPLLCSTNEICPELALRWNDEKRNGFKITADINDTVEHDIKQLSFIVDGQPYTYSTIQPTQYKTLANVKNSANFISVPVSFLNSFRDAKQIDLKIVTANSEIIRPILQADGQKSSAYLTFIKGYTGQSIQ